MKKRRGNGEGSISQRKDGTWQAQITIGYNPTTGKPIRPTFYGDTRREASEKLNAVLNSRDNGTYIEPNQITLGDWLDKWLNESAKTKVRPTTFVSYEYIVRVHLKPTIGSIKLKNLKTADIQRLINEKLSNGRVRGTGSLSPRTIKYMSVILHEALEQAVKENYISRNMATAVSVPRQQRKDIHIFSKDDQSKFINIAASHRLGAAFILDLATGLRVGELLGLHWHDINLDEGIIKVTQSLSRVKVFDESSDAKTKLIFQEPKTEAGKRSIPIPENATLKLREYRKRQMEEKLRLGPLYDDNDLVFCTEAGMPIDPRNFARIFNSLLKSSGIPHTNLHALRHTYATRLLELNEHPKIVQELLGHSSITMTLDIYSHVTPEIKQAAAEKLNSLFEAKRPSNKEGLSEK